MGYELNRNIGVALNTAASGATPVFSEVRAGIKHIVRASEPYIRSVYYIGSGCAKTDVLGVRKLIKLTGVRVSGDAANAFICGLYGKTGDDCRTEAVLYDRTSLSGGVCVGKLVPVTVVMKGDDSSCGDADSPFSEFECDIYLNGEGVDGSYSVS